MASYESIHKARTLIGSLFNFTRFLHAFYTLFTRLYIINI